MARVIVLGAGKIGSTVAQMLAEQGEDEVTLADCDEAGLAARIPAGVDAKVIDVTDPFALRAGLSGHQVVVAALPYFLDADVAVAARAEGLHYFDLTEDVATRRAIQAIAEGASTAFVPQCGLAPGFIAIAAMGLVERFDEVLDVRLRVGALPQYPDNALKYNLTWSIDGLINEYCNPCEALVGGHLMEVLPLEGLEGFSLDGVSYECFSTSGGAGTLCETLAGRAVNIDYKTVRYPGHRNLICLLARDLKLGQRRDIFRDVIEHAVPMTRQDVVLIFVTVVGRQKGLLTQESWVRKIYGDAFEGGRSAIQKTTAAGICAMVDLHRRGMLPPAGFVRQEDARLADILASPFGQVFR